MFISHLQQCFVFVHRLAAEIFGNLNMNEDHMFGDRKTENKQKQKEKQGEFLSHDHTFFHVSLQSKRKGNNHHQKYKIYNLIVVFLSSKEVRQELYLDYI